MRQRIALASILFFAVCSRTLPAQDTWVQKELLPRLSGHAMAYDALRNRTMLFGARTQRPEDSAWTWEWDGSQWASRGTPGEPPLRIDPAVAYDRARGEVIVFGGRTANGLELDETWIWNGHEWSQRFPSVSPPARIRHEMAYDQGRQRVVLFGGIGGSGTPGRSDTWEWDGNNWTLRTPTRSPSSRYGHAMAFDVSRGLVVLYGGLSPAGLTDTWEWDGVRWTQRLGVGSPSASTGMATVYDARRRRLVLYGGSIYPPYTSPAPNGTWEYDGTSWRLVATTVDPGVRNSPAMVYDEARQRAVLYGGDWGNILSGTWEWDGALWVERFSGGSPILSGGSSLTFDSARGRAVLFHGSLNQAPTNGSGPTTWEWDGSRWSQRMPVSSPPVRLGQAMTYEPGRARTVLFGGLGEGLMGLADTWEWDGTTWTRRFTTYGPTPRSGAAMCRDLASGDVLLFGGYETLRGELSNETWRYNGRIWVLLPSTFQGPIPRAGHAMAFDPVRGRVVLFGGSNGANPPHGYNDTWEWDGVLWQRISTRRRPPGRIDAKMTYDERRGQMLLYGGHDGPLQRWNDLWAYNGSNWVELEPSERPSFDPYQSMTYDSIRLRTLLVTGGRDGIGTWVFGPPGRAATAPLPGGCSGTAGVPELAGIGRPVLGSSTFGLELFDARPNALAVILFSRGTASIPQGTTGCVLRVDPSLLVTDLSLLVNPSGFARLDLPPLGWSPSIYGQELAAQVLVVDPLGAFGGIASFTDGLRMVIGD